eukprot:scaffold113110_cov24-Prasinocladus_malaysianus.AAC.2
MKAATLSQDYPNQSHYHPTLQVVAERVYAIHLLQFAAFIPSKSEVAEVMAWHLRFIPEREPSA